MQHEVVGNLHIHTTYSDGTGTPEQIAAAARGAGLDFLVINDHNVRVPEHQGWHDGLLLLVGQEVHQPEHPHQNHYLVFDAGRDMAPDGKEGPSALLPAVRQAGGFGAIAHPYERAGRFSGEPVIPWSDWTVADAEAIEIWNYMSEFKSYLTGPLRTLLYAYAPRLAIRGPYRETLTRWDQLLAQQKTVAVAGSDAHATLYQVGPLKRRVFGYDHLFNAVNMHLWLPSRWTRDVERDAEMVHGALAAGCSFVGYDGLAPTRGFRFWAQGSDTLFYPGDRCTTDRRVKLIIETPATARIRLMLNGFCVAQEQGRRLEHISDAPGVYRVECYRRHALRERGWIFSNLIWIGDDARRAGRHEVGQNDPSRR